MHGKRRISCISSWHSQREKPLALFPVTLHSLPFLCTDLTLEMAILLYKSDINESDFFLKLSQSLNFLFLARLTKK